MECCACKEVVECCACEEVVECSARKEVDCSACEEVVDCCVCEEVVECCACEEVVECCACEEVVECSARKEVVDCSACEEVVDCCVCEEVVECCAGKEVVECCACEEVVECCACKEVSLSTKLYATDDTVEEVATPATASSTVSLHKPPPYKVIPPRFNGKAREFHVFQERFTDIMDTHKDYYTDADKVNILADSMDDEVARQIVLDNYSSGMNTALEELQAAYGRKSVIYPLLIEDLLKREKIDYTADGMRNAIDRTKKILEDMERIDGKDIEFLTVAMAIRDFDSETRTEWLKQLSSADELPTLEKFLEFVTPLSRNLPRRSKISQHKFQGSKQQYQGNNYHGNNHHSSKEATNSTTTTASTIALEVKQEATTPSKKKPCPICKEEKSHPTYRCKKFKEGTVPQRLQWVKQYKLCPNCLHNSHQKVEDCTSTYTCRH